MIKSNGEDPVQAPSYAPTSGRERSSAVTETSTVTVPLDGTMSEEEAFDWLNAQIDYLNLAADEDIALRAKAYVDQVLQRFRSEISDIHRKWEVVLYACRGNTFARSVSGRQAVHVPELYKILETLIPRLEEAVFHYRDWFSVQGRESSDKKQERVIQEFLRYQLYRAHFQELIHPAFRLMLQCGVAPFKIYWHTQTREVVKREVTKKVHGDKATYTKKRNVRKEVTYNGPVIRLIDPFDLIVDLEAMNVRDAMFIGDRTTMTYDEIAELGEQGVYHGWEKLKERADRRDPLRMTSKQARGPEMSFLTGSHLEGGPKRFDVVEMWCLFDAYGTGRTREYVLTIADNDCVLRVQENHHDDKHRPYAVARASREPFRFFNTAPLDLAVPLQFEIDEHRNLMADAQRYAITPIVWVDSNDDLPDSFFGLEPGKILRSRTPPTWLKGPTAIADYLPFHQMLRLDMEETTGAPRVMQGTGETNTATEIERKLQEGNKRSAGYVRSMTSCMEDMLRIIYGLDQQYVSQAQVFRVLGKAGSKLTAFMEIDPAQLETEVDFEFIGPSNLQTVGMRGTNLQNFLTVAYPFIGANPNSVDVPALLADLFDNMVGTRLGTDVVKIPQALDEMMSPEEENILLLQGQEVAIHEADDHLHHEEIHEPEQYTDTFKKLSWREQQWFFTHQLAHKSAREKQAAMEAAKNKQQPGFSTPPVPPEVDADRGTTGARGPTGETPSPGQSASGETPGPPSPFGSRSADRKGGMFQTDAMAQG